MFCLNCLHVSVCRNVIKNCEGIDSFERLIELLETANTVQVVLAQFTE